MSNEENVGNRAVPVWELIVQLEDKVRAKNKIIRELEYDVTDWRNKFILALTIKSVAFWLGMGVGLTIPLVGFVVWRIIHG